MNNSRADKVETKPGQCQSSPLSVSRLRGGCEVVLVRKFDARQTISRPVQRTMAGRKRKVTGGGVSTGVNHPAGLLAAAVATWVVHEATIEAVEIAKPMLVMH